MRTRTLLLVALIALPSVASSQRIRLPRRRPNPEPASLPPQVPTVERALAYKRSRWSAEGYTLVSRFQIPDPGGGISAYTDVGSGTHAEYRYTEHWSASIDLTASMLGSPARAQTAEVGSRYSPLSWTHTLRPYFDVRLGYMHMFDPFGLPLYGDPSNPGSAAGSRYSRGFGGVAGVGFEYSLTRSLALTNQLSAMRSDMTTYRITPGTVQNGTKFWMTTVRYTIGLKFNPVRALYFKQSPRQ